ncbi:quinone oxidoreductase family protein [Sandarakinorhabdus limnophila]|uniref:quinone oxidoreductase family protein n=1 Tax=Sandarakinorhabdus limnophila TaxID=210512 RepID=UPI00048D5D50|nr:quinone oxidoreductase [Sandarakinorhabdus limnophila]
MVMKAIRIDASGGPEVMQWQDITLPPLGPGEVQLRHTAIGLNFIDTYHRSGLYPIAFPSGLGLEAAGVVEAVGEGVTLSVGTRVGYCWGPIGAYATYRNIAAAMLVPLPDGVSDEMAAAGLLKGCTTEFLVERCAKVRPGDWALVPAAAGGVGLLLVQWLKLAGATVIAVAGTQQKLALAAAHGADHGVLDGSDVAAQVRALTGGRGVDVVFDGVGKNSWESSLDSLKRRGLMISFGNASGPVSGVDLGILARKGSLFATRPTLFDYYATPEERLQHAGRVLGLMASGGLKLAINQRYKLANAAKAHEDLAARLTTGSTVLVP